MKKLVWVLAATIALSGCGCSMFGEEATESVIGGEISTEIVFDDGYDFVEKDEEFTTVVTMEGDEYEVNMIRHFSGNGYVIEYDSDNFVRDETKTGEFIVGTYNEDVYVSVDVYPNGDMDAIVAELPVGEMNDEGEALVIYATDDEKVEIIKVIEAYDSVYVVSCVYPNDAELAAGYGARVQSVADSFRLQ